MNRKTTSRRKFLQAGAGAAAAVGLPSFSRDVLTTESETASQQSSTDLIQTGPTQISTSLMRPVDYVNVLFGTSSLDDPELIGNAPPPGEELYSGMVAPGAALPHGIHIGPINKDISLAYPHGNLYSYVYSRRTVVGFSSMVTDSLIMPLVGDWTTPPDRIRYASVYDKASERSVPGRCSVYLQDHKIQVDLTATPLAGLFRFTFPKTDRATILLDLGPGDGSMEIIGDRTIRGCANQGKEWFILEFSKPFRSFGTFCRRPPSPNLVGYGWFLLGMDSIHYASRSQRGSFAGCYLNYATAQDEQVLAKIAAGSSFEQAQNRLRSGLPDWDFEKFRRTAADVWNRKLSSIEVKGGSERNRRIFYSALYHAFASPTMIVRRGEQFIGQDKKVYLAQYDRYDEVPYWDTGRNQVVLLTLLDPQRKLDILRSQLDMAKESGWMGTSFHGDHAVAMYLGDWERGLTFDYEEVYSYLRKNAVDPRGPRSHLAEYLEKGWIHDIVVDSPSPPYDEGNAGVSKTLEYCYDDHCLAMYAKKLGKSDDFRMFMTRARNYRNVWDRSTGFMRGRKEDGGWIIPFDPTEPYYNFMYKESNSWQTTWFVPHDIAGLMELMGGRTAFIQKLDDFFSLPYRPTGIARDVSGLIGQYNHGNEPDHHVPYLYNWAGAPWKCQQLVRKIMNVMYGSDKDGLGLAGMDDQGENCSWYVLNALGFYTVNPARAEYVIGSPLFDEAVIHMGNGRDFTIVAHNNSEQNVYIESALLNGRILDRPWFEHSEISNGGELVVSMGPDPNLAWGASTQASPP